MFTTTLTHFFVAASHQFTGEGYLEYRTTSGNIINSDKDELRIEFSTVQPSGLLFYNYARNSGGQFADYVALELVGGRLRYVLLTVYDMCSEAMYNLQCIMYNAIKPTVVSNKEMLVFLCIWIHDGAVCLAVSDLMHTCKGSHRSHGLIIAAIWNHVGKNVVRPLPS